MIKGIQNPEITAKLNEWKKHINFKTVGALIGLYLLFGIGRVALYQIRASIKFKEAQPYIEEWKSRKYTFPLVSMEKTNLILNSTLRELRQL